MPEQETTETLTVEEAQEIANENGSFGNAEREVLARLERIDGEERHRWAEAAEEIRNNWKAFKAMNMDPDFPNDALHAIRDPEDWDTLDPMDVNKVTCSATGKELYEVEVEHPSYTFSEDDNVTYIDNGGSEYGGMYVTDDEGEYYDVDDDSDHFVNGRILTDLEPNNRNSTTITAFVPSDEDDEVAKVRIEKAGTIRRDMAFEQEDSYDLLQDYPEIEALVDAIILGDEDNEALEGWVPVEARPENGTNRSMEEKVQEIASTIPDEYYFDFPTVAVLGREGSITGKRYVAVPEDHAEDADEWFDPALY